jgi:hypothetical protein
MYKCGALKPVEVILRRGMGRKKKNGGNEPNQVTIYVYMEMPQQPPL